VFLLLRPQQNSLLLSLSLPSLFLSSLSSPKCTLSSSSSHSPHRLLPSCFHAFRTCTTGGGFLAGKEKEPILDAALGSPGMGVCGALTPRDGVVVADGNDDEDDGVVGGAAVAAAAGSGVLSSLPFAPASDDLRLVLSFSARSRASFCRSSSVSCVVGRDRINVLLIGRVGVGSLATLVSVVCAAAAAAAARAACAAAASAAACAALAASASLAASAALAAFSASTLSRTAHIGIV
jgi:hypothetical protein